ncbi:phytochrome-like protein cph1 [mine drainage metagenome]|uniref:histidine kinase n=1 Tax=mine drainage metagenome TaxID=410659 RepID=A0A1J5RNH9_9ZZZZ
MMRGYRLPFLLLLLAVLGATLLASRLALQSGDDTSLHTRTIASFDAIARAETDLDRDVLQVAAAALPNYDPFVVHTRALRAALDQAEAQVRALGAGDSAAEWQHYRALITQKLTLADHIKRTAAFANNEENYLPAAVEAYAAHADPATIRALRQALILVLSVKIPDDLPERLQRVLPRGAARTEAATLTLHAHMLAEQRLRLRDAVDAYFQVRSHASMTAARRLYMSAYAARQEGRHRLLKALIMGSAGLLPLLAGLLALLLRAERQNRQTLEHMRKLGTAVEQSPIAIMITDAEGTIEYVNPQFQTITGYTAAEACGKTPRLLKSGRTDPAQFRALWSTIRSGMTWQGELINRRKDGSDLIEQAVISPIADENGHITHYVGMKQDITQLRRQEDLLSSVNVDLEQLLFATCHDLQEPARQIATMAQLLERTLPAGLSEEAGFALGAILTESAQLRVFVAGLSEFARAGQSRHAFSEVDLNALLAALVREMDGAGDSISLSALPVVPGDPARLFILFDTLLSNALKFRSPDRPLAITVSACRDGDLWRFEIKDNGIGIEARYLPTLIRPFSRLHPRTRYPGSGLGLITALRIARQHNGTLSIQSEPDRGTTVQVWLRGP